MTILDRTRGSRRIRIDVNRLADELGRHVPELDKVDLSKVDLARARAIAESAVQDAAERARESLDRASETARTLRSDFEKSAEKVQADNPLDELGQRIRAVATTTGIRAVIARLERELPDTDKDRYSRAYLRGRAQGRTRYLVIGVAAGVTTGIVAAVLLDPVHGAERRASIGRRLRALTGRVSEQASAAAQAAQERAREVAAERGIVQERKVPIGVMDLPPADGPVTRVVADVEAGAHEALPDELVSAATVSDPTEPAVHDPRA